MLQPALKQMLHTNPGISVERLTFQVNPNYSKDFLLADAEVWNPWLKRQPGFLDKTTRIVGNGLVELTLFWRDKGSLEKAASKRSEMAMVEDMMRRRFPMHHHLVSSSAS